MRPIVITTICAALAVGLLASCSASLTEQSARSVVEAEESAATQLRFNDLGAYHSDDCVSISNVANSDGVIEDHKKSCQQDIEESSKMLNSALSGGSTIRYDSTISSVAVVGDKAVAHVHSALSITRGDKSLVGEDDQSLTLQLRNGKVLITEVVSHPTHVTVNGKALL